MKSFTLFTFCLFFLVLFSCISSVQPLPHEKEQDASVPELQEELGPLVKEQGNTEHWILRLKCEELVREFWKFLDKHNSCTKDEDCVLLRTEGGCDCKYSIYSSSAASVPKRYKEFELFNQRFFSDECKSIRVCVADNPSDADSKAVCTRQKCNHQPHPSARCWP